MRIAHGSHLAAVAAAAFALACGGSPSDSRSSTSSSALAHCTAVEDLKLDRQASCASAAPDFIAFRKTQVEATCSPIAREVSAGRAKLDEARAGSCLAELKKLDCDGFGAAMADDAYAPCAGVLTGTAANGGTCYADADCASGRCALSTACPGSCVAFAAQGERCTPGSCRKSLYCHTATSTCRPQHADGPCSGDDDNECTFGNSCYFGGQGSPECRPLGSAQAACGGDVGGDCGLGFHCDIGYEQSTKKCVADPVVGQSCVDTLGGTTFTFNCVGGFCDAASRTCKACPAACPGACDSTGQCPAVACAIP
jgi:hypothetical protein